MSEVSHNTRVQIASLKLLHDWMLENGHDLSCPDDIEDPLDAAELLEYYVNRVVELETLLVSMSNDS